MTAVDRRTYQAGETVVVTVDNRRGETVEDIERPSAVQLQRHRNGSWEFQPTPWTGIPELDVYYGIKACTAVTRPIVLPPDLRPGRYRFVFHGRWFTEPFDVRSGPRSPQVPKGASNGD